LALGAVEYDEPCRTPREVDDIAVERHAVINGTGLSRER